MAKACVECASRDPVADRERRSENEVQVRARTSAIASCSGEPDLPWVCRHKMDLTARKGAQQKANSENAKTKLIESPWQFITASVAVVFLLISGIHQESPTKSGRRRNERFLGYYHGFRTGGSRCREER